MARLGKYDRAVAHRCGGTERARFAEIADRGEVAISDTIDAVERRPAGIGAGVVAHREANADRDLAVTRDQRGARSASIQVQPAAVSDGDRAVCTGTRDRQRDRCPCSRKDIVAGGTQGGIAARVDRAEVEIDLTRECIDAVQYQGASTRLGQAGRARDHRVHGGRAAVGRDRRRCACKVEGSTCQDVAGCIERKVVRGDRAAQCHRAGSTPENCVVERAVAPGGIGTTHAVVARAPQGRRQVPVARTTVADQRSVEIPIVVVCRRCLADRQSEQQRKSEGTDADAANGSHRTWRATGDLALPPDQAAASKRAPTGIVTQILQRCPCPILPRHRARLRYVLHDFPCFFSRKRSPARLHGWVG